MSDDPNFIERTLRPLLNNEAQTDDSGWYPEIEPRRYRADAAEVLEAVEVAIGGRDRWELVESDDEDLEVHAEIHTRWIDFIDDLTVRLESDGDEIFVHARSESRVGKGDFGQNARTVRELFERLDREMEHRL